MNEEEKQATEIAKTQEETEAPEEEKSTPSSPLGGRSVFAYLAVLFGVAFLLLLFAYLMQQRDSQEITAYLSQLRESMGSIQSIDQLVEENRQLREENEGLKGQVSGLETERDDLKNELEISNGIIGVRDHDQQEMQHIISALDTLARVRTLYEEDHLDEAREILDELPLEEGTDQVEYYLTIYANLYSPKNMGMADPELYNPLKEWRALKEALAETEEEEYRFT